MKEGMFGDVFFAAKVVVTAELEESGKLGVRQEAIANLRMKLADAIVSKKLQEVKNPFHKEYSLELYVLTPSEMEQLVNREYIIAKLG